MGYCKKYDIQTTVSYCLACKDCLPPSERIGGRMCENEVMEESVDALRVREFLVTEMLDIGRVSVDGDKEAITMWYSAPIRKWPRKLKKGVRTLRDGKPRTKWQRRGQLLAVKLWNGLGLTVAKVAIIGSLPFRLPHNFKPGGLVAKPTINPCLNKGELVMTRESAEALMRHISEKGKI